MGVDRFTVWKLLAAMLTYEIGMKGEGEEKKKKEKREEKSKKKG
jgi:hypothetical protein